MVVVGCFLGGPLAKRIAFSNFGNAIPIAFANSTEFAITCKDVLIVIKTADIVNLILPKIGSEGCTADGQTFGIISDFSSAARTVAFSTRGTDTVEGSTSGTCVASLLENVIWAVSESTGNWKISASSYPLDFGGTKRPEGEPFDDFILF
jgi:hypothetical protein